MARYERETVRQQLPWNDTDRETLRAYAGKVSAMELAGLLGGRHSIESIRSEMKALERSAVERTPGK